jgi:hypothetical protein
MGPSDISIGAPLLTRSSLGNENYNVACAHTHIRHALDPTLSGSIQHEWRHGPSDMKSEQMWCRFRKTWAPGFEALLEKGIEQLWYDSANVADRYVCCS